MKLGGWVAAAPHLAGAVLLALHPHTRPEATHAAALSHPPVVVREEAPRVLPARTLMMTLESGEWTPGGRPNTWVHIPRGFRPSSKLAFTFLFHGFKNCIESYTGPGTQCRLTNDPRPGYDVAAQLEEAGARSIVVVPETSFDRTLSAEAPRLSQHGAFRAYIDELLAALGTETGGATFANLERVALAASSGGYQALEPILADTESFVTDVLLLDAGYLYPNSAVGRFLTRVIDERNAATPSIEESGARTRFGILYTPSGGARPASEELLERTRNRLRAPSPWARFRHTREDPRSDDLAAPLYILRVDEEHDTVVRRNLGRVIAAAGL